MASRTEQERMPLAGASVLKRALWTAAALLLALLLYAQTCHVAGLTFGLFLRQDRPILLLDVLLLAAIAAFGDRLKLPAASPRLSAPAVIGIALVLALLLWAGTYALMGDYPFTRDEQMAAFDGAIFRHLQTSAPLTPAWRAFAPAMEPLYMLPITGNSAWASGYLPGNAALRAGFSAIADPALMNPILAGLSAWLVWAIARQLFPSSRSAPGVALLVLASSSQMAVGAMTPFAMTAHLAFNLLWLLLFLRGGRIGHGLAGTTGFVATGLHQIIFHPLFALPFLEHLRRRRQWRTACFYLAVYAAAGWFWMSYPHWVAASAGGGGAVPAPAAGAASFLRDRVLPLLVTRDPETVPLMAFNLLRFAAWQNLAALPLAFCAWHAIRKGEGIAAPLAVGILLTVAAMLVLLPYQSIGWGYRYLHGLLGSFALLAAYGWERVKDEPAARPLVAGGSLITFAVAIPFLLIATRAIVAPSIAAEHMLERVHANFLVIDPPGLAADQVRNDPWLAIRPLRFSSDRLGPNDIDLLCSRGRIAFVGRDAFRRVGLGAEGDPPPDHFLALRARAAQHGCLAG